jgi:XTP/dITP diphosphohydrolase
MALNELVLASHNAGKLREIAALVAPLGIHARSAAELNVDEPEETGLTFAENAILKARNAAEKTNLPALSDDSGMAIPALDGAPGIYSARWSGPDKDFSVAFERIQKELSEKRIDPNGGVAAQFICALCLYMPDGQAHVFEGRIDGTLTFPPRGNHGFGYDPIFIPEGEMQSFGEIMPERKHAMSHRARAFAQFLNYLESIS